MTEKYKKISKLAQETSKNIARNGETWCDYLNTAARLYKYTFKEQMLIFAQRPGATACADMGTWNASMKCRVNKGAKGIAIIDEEASVPGLKYVFDVADVQKLGRDGRYPYLWNLKEEHKEEILERLEKLYGDTDSRRPFEGRLLEIASMIALNCPKKLLVDLKHVTEGSFLEGLDDVSLMVRFRDLLQSSIGYTLLSRCGADVEDFIDELNFEYLSEFNTMNTLSILGCNTTMHCKTILMEIGKCIRFHERGITEENPKIAVAKRSEKSYNELTHRSAGKVIDNVVEAVKPLLERGKENGDNISSGRGLPNPGYSNGRTTGGDIDQIRVNEKEIPAGREGGDLHGTSLEQQAHDSFVGNTGCGREENGGNYTPDGAERGSDGRIESTGSDEVGRHDEQHSTFGRGNRSGGIDLQLDSISRKSGNQGLPDFLMESEEELIHSLICSDQYMKNKRPDIAGRFQMVIDLNKRADYVKGSYNEEYTEFDIGTNRVGYKAWNEGLVIWRGHYLTRSCESMLSWDAVRDLVDTYIREKRYLLPGERVMEEPEEIDDYKQLSLFQIATEETTTRHMEPIGGNTPVTQDEKNVIDKGDTANFHITDDGLGIGSAKRKFERNVSAIKTLQMIEGEKRFAIVDEQGILSQYTGWGGLAEAFNIQNNSWSKEYGELKALLSENEYASARESTLNAHYTSPIIIRSMFDTLDRMGFKKGNLLEPAMGTGNFFGMLPNGMKGSQLYGVELDELTGRIARQLYPDAHIKIEGFEKANYPNDFFDVVVGNVPFGQYKVADKAYDKHHFLVHDYFLAKSLDKVRTGGVIAVITSRGTMDKKNSAARKYLAQRAKLLGAVRLPNTAFKENAGTEVTSDILFFQKSDRVIDLEPEWVHLAENEDGIAMNQYFVEHPKMIVGKMERVSGPYGMEPTCKPNTETSFEKQLKEALQHISGKIIGMGDENPKEGIDIEIRPTDPIIPADPSVKNYSYTVVGEIVYYREDSIMMPVDLPEATQERIRGMVKIRNCTQDLISYQLEEYGEDDICEKRTELNQLYDAFSKKFGLVSSKENRRAFNKDSGYCLLCSLEELADDGSLMHKADMFTKRTIKRQETIISVDTASEALTVSLCEKAGVDISYMAGLLGEPTNYNRVISGLQGVIFKDPLSDMEDPCSGWQTADEYLSGNVREKLETARLYAENHEDFDRNVKALEQVQPKRLGASEIIIRLGATWVDPKYINDFMCDVFKTPKSKLEAGLIGAQYSKATGQWNVKGKNMDLGNVITEMKYGTSKANAYKILEDSLNLRDIQMYDTVMEEGKEKRVISKKETLLASKKQEAIREVYGDWIFKAGKRREELCDKYNKIFNSNRAREYEGSHIRLPGITPDIELKPHQKNAIARVLYGGNTLLAHCVGAGKTFEMAAAAMESKRLGLAQKSLFVVPNHLTRQWAGDFLRLYPGASILAATQKDFEPINRKKFCSRIATGDYDAVIIGHSQFEKIPLSRERQKAMIERQIKEIVLEIENQQKQGGERYTIKQMEKSRKSLAVKLERLNDSTRKDDVVTFEQLGVDRLFVDESQGYKNLFLYTKMKNVSGVTQSQAQKSSDMLAKCQYIDEITGRRGIIFATGTPISNSMTELYIIMRYLQYGTLQKLGLGHFDSWAAAFGETKTEIELAPEGTGYRSKTRFAKFFNLPELISIFKECADIQTKDMLKLPVPDVVYENVVLKPSEHQLAMVKALAGRAEVVRAGLVDSDVDNMLKIVNDGRKLALDQRLANPMLPDNEDSKANACVEKAIHIWKESQEEKATQLIFCDLSTPKGISGVLDGYAPFKNVYEDIRNKLIAKGVPEHEVAFIHDGATRSCI